MPEKKKPDLGIEPLESDALIEGVRNEAVEAGEQRYLADMRLKLSGAHDFWRPIQEQAAKDLDFIYGEQWDPAELKRRKRQRLPALTLNVQQAFVANVRGAALGDAVLGQCLAARRGGVPGEDGRRRPDALDG